VNEIAFKTKIYFLKLKKRLKTTARAAAAAAAYAVKVNSKFKIYSKFDQA